MVTNNKRIKDKILLDMMNVWASHGLKSIVSWLAVKTNTGGEYTAEYRGYPNQNNFSYF